MLLAGLRGSSVGRNVCVRIEPFDEENIRRYLEAHGIEAGAVAARYGAEGIEPSVYLADPEGNVVELQRAVAEMARAVRPGGTVAAYVWDYAEKMELMRYFWDAAIALNDAVIDLDEGRRFPICHPVPLAELFTQTGLHAVEVRPIDVATHFRDFDDYWSPFLGGQGPAPAYAMSLSVGQRGALRDRIRSKLPVSQDGSIDLIARAWAIRGRVRA